MHMSAHQRQMYTGLDSAAMIAVEIADAAFLSPAQKPAEREYAQS